MSLGGNRWIWLDQNNDKATALAQILDLPPAMARLLVNRGIDDPAQARAFLCPSSEQFHSPWLMQGMEQAVDRLHKALERGEKIIVHGDYDADGIAASVLLVDALRRLGAEVEFFLPSRFDEGYGLHIESLQRFKDEGASLVVTVDCGVNAAEEVEFAAGIGLDVVVTDHHQPLGMLKRAVSIVNPLQQNCPYPFKELSGSGIAFKLASALLEKAGLPFPEDLLDLAALGTAADVVPLVRENRLIVAEGLKVIRRLERPGFKALAAAVSLERERISSTTLAFVLAPAVNAAGRMGEALPAAELFLENNEERAAELAGQLHRSNQLRRLTEQKILQEAEDAAFAGPVPEGQKIITLAGDNWHHGVIGIVASRLVDKYNRPVALVALEEGEGRGSARSVPGFNITDALAYCAPLLERFGGHDQAAGFTLRADKVTQLREALNRYASEHLPDQCLDARLYLEAELTTHDITLDLAAELDRLQPFGTANPVPLFGSRGWEIESWRLVGADKSHLKLKVNKGGFCLEPIVFSGADLASHLEVGRLVDLAFRLKRGYFRERETLEVEVKDISYGDKVVSSSLELIDRRHTHKNREHSLQNILGQDDLKAVVFISTLSRAKRLEENCPSSKRLHFISGGKANGNQKLPEAFNTVILFDLPLHEEPLKLLMVEGLKQGPLTVHLLYGREDLERNRLLTDLSLPSANQLNQIMTALTESRAGGRETRFPGSAADKFEITPAPGFWARAEKIFTEIGLLQDGFLSPAGLPAGERWPQLLNTSSTYLASAELRESCERFQQLLLEGPLEEIASYLHDLTRR